MVISKPKLCSDWLYRPLYLCTLPPLPFLMILSYKLVYHKRSKRSNDQKTIKTIKTDSPHAKDRMYCTRHRPPIKHHPLATVIPCFTQPNRQPTAVLPGKYGLPFVFSLIASGAYHSLQVTSDQPQPTTEELLSAR